MLLSQMKKYICCFMRVTHAMNNIYITDLIFELLLAVFFYKKLLDKQDFMIVMNSNFLSAMHNFRDNEVYCQPHMTSS